MFTLVEIFPDSAMYLDLLRLGIFGFADAYIHYDTQSNHLSFRIQNPRTCNETGAILNGDSRICMYSQPLPYWHLAITDGG